MAWLARLALLKYPVIRKKLRITDLARSTGLSKSTLIRYEEEGKLPKACRDGRKWRFYTQAECDLIVKKLKKLGLI